MKSGDLYLVKMHGHWHIATVYDTGHFGLHFSIMGGVLRKPGDIEIESYLSMDAVQSLGELHTIECKICGNPILHAIESPKDVTFMIECSTCLTSRMKASTP